MMRRHVLGLIALPLLAAAAGAQVPDPYESKVQGLAHPRYAEREKAARELLAAGEPALKALRAASNSTDPELRRRAAAIAEKIDLAVRSERLLAAPKTALKLDNVPLQQAVMEVARKTGLHLQLEPTTGADFRRPVTVDTGELPFWEAVHAFYNAAGLVEEDGPPASSPGVGGPGRAPVRYRRVYGIAVLPNSVIRLKAGKDSLPAATDKAIRVRALPPGFADNKYDADRGELTLNLDVDAAPALTVQEILGVEVRRAIGDDRQVLAPTYPAPALRPGYSATEQLLIARQVIIVNGEVIMDDGMGGSHHYPVVLKTGGNRPRKLSELHGVVVARVITPAEPLITVADVFGKGKNQTRSADGISFRMTATLDGPRPGTAAVQFWVQSSAENFNQMLNFPVQIKGRVRPFVRINRRGTQPASNAPEFDIRGPDGQALKITSTQIVASEMNGWTVANEYRVAFEKPPEDGAKSLDGINLTLHGRRSVLVEMPFVLKDVPLP